MMSTNTGGATPNPAREDMLAAIAVSVRNSHEYTGLAELDERVMAAMAAVPREQFVLPAYRHLAYQNTPLPIAAGQTISQPLIVALMTHLLDPQPEDVVLEVGTGSGFMAALLGHRAQRVLTLEIDPALAETAHANLQRAGVLNVEVRLADGASTDLSADGPFDAILLSGSVAEVPRGLLEQLKVGGRLMAIVGEEPMMRASLVQRTGENSWTESQPWDIVAPRLIGFPTPPRFHF